MLKAPPLKSSVLHFSVLQNRPDRGQLMCSKICSKSSKISKQVDNAYFWTNLSPILVEFIVKHIIRPQNSKPRLFKFRTDIEFIGSKLHFITEKCRSEDLRSGAFGIRQKNYLFSKPCKVWHPENHLQFTEVVLHFAISVH